MLACTGKAMASVVRLHPSIVKCKATMLGGPYFPPRGLAPRINTVLDVKWTYTNIELSVVGRRHVGPGVLVAAGNRAWPVRVLDNPHDPNAVAVHTSSGRIGWWPMHRNKHIAKALDERRLRINIVVRRVMPCYSRCFVQFAV